ncbi:MAG TPA: gamma-glutamyltransferase family protein [Thermomicrobiales bacterium]|jgi:gamma-glutamyltranspeptidase/glutathione hydrolase|nr:gamma-glutamyltransferase family protein [Thermomicrobiales bacterium]
MVHVSPSRSTFGFNGMVSAPHILAAQAGVTVLREGGTAIDAAIATDSVLCVLYPHMTTVGGDMFLLYHEAATGKLHALNGSGRSALGTSREFVRAAGHETMPVRGIHAVTVPGTVDAWEQSQRAFGRMSLPDVLQYAIDYAEEGFPVSVGLANGLRIAEELLSKDPEAHATYLPDGRVPAPGTRLRLPALAESFRQIADGGREAFYRGPIAERIASTSHRLGGALNVADLAAHRGDWVEPVFGTYRDVSVAEFPPNSQGITALIELNLAELVEAGTDWESTARLHALVEAKKLAFEVRNRTITDPTFHDIDVQRLTSKEYATDLWRQFSPERARNGQPDGDADTVAICVVDGEGNAAAMIQSQYMGFGSGVMAEGTGIMLQNRGGYFSLSDDHPNRLEPGKRTLHTLMPGMLYRNGQLAGPMVTQGGDAQAQVHLQLVTSLADFDLWDNPQFVLDLPRWVSGGDRLEVDHTLQLEDRFTDETVQGLAGLGHEIQRIAPFASNVGVAQLILRDPETGLLRGASDCRADGVALGL